MIMALLGLFGSLGEAERTKRLRIVVVTFENGMFFDDALGMGPENCPGRELLLKTNDCGLQVLQLMSGTNECIPHDFGLLIKGKSGESFLRPTNRHGHAVKNRKRQDVKVEFEHGRIFGSSNESSNTKLINKRKFMRQGSCGGAWERLTHSATPQVPRFQHGFDALDTTRVPTLYIN